MTSFTVEPIYGSLWLVIAAIIATLVVVIVVAPPTHNVNQRRLLISLRLLASVVLLLALLRPTLLHTDNRPADAALVVAVDTSRSMTLPDGEGGIRWETQVQAWRDLATGLAKLDESLVIRLIGYDSNARPIAPPTPESLDNQTPSGERTDLSAATLAAIQAAEGQPMTGMVLIGDGVQTAPLQGPGARRVVETLRTLGVPLWSIPIGPPGGDEDARDVAIDALPESYQLFSGNDVDIQFQVLSRGMSGRDVPVRLSWLDEEGNVSEVAVRHITSAKADDVAAVSINLTAPQPGTYRLVVQADTQTGELITTNNQQIAFVDVREGGGRILYLEGQQRPEQLFLRRALRRFPDLDMTYRWIPSDTARSWPIDLRNLLSPGKFDIYILGDLPAEALGDPQLQQISRAIQDGAGLITLGGDLTYEFGGYGASSLAEVIPVQMQRARPAPAQRTKPVQVRPARIHPITDLGGDDPQELWRRLPSLTGYTRMPKPKIAPGIEVLLESPEQDPLLVVGQYGRGRVAALALDSTWRWWKTGESELHRRFWRQLVLWLLSREEVGGDKIRIEMDLRRFSVGQSPEFRASLDSLAKDMATELVAELIDENGAIASLETVKESQSGSREDSNSIAIRGKLAGVKASVYRLRVRPQIQSDSITAEEMAFQVIDESREMARPMADPVYLKQLAELTRDQGGAAFSSDQMEELLKTIAEKRKQAETPVVEKSRLGDGPKSGWLLFALFAMTLSAEWFLRRQWGLA